MMPSKPAPQAMTALTPAHPRRAARWQGGLRLGFALLLLLISWLALSPSPPQLPATGWDKLNHLLAFAALGCCGALAWPGRRRWLVAGLLAYGLLIELVQGLVPGRFSEPADVLADLLGIAVGLLLAALLAWLSRPRSPA